MMRADRHSGFTMIDLLIGLAIGLMGLLAVTQVMLTFNQQRNTAVQLMESQNNGTMALYLLERDLGQAGYGLMNLQNCSQIQWYYGALQGPLSPLPVWIQDGGTGSDTLNIQYANATSGAPVAIITQPQTAYADPYTLGTIVGFNVGDVVVANVSNTCTMSQVTAINNVNFTIAHAVDPVDPGVTPYNTTTQPAGATGGWNVATAQSLLVNVGSFVGKRYSIANERLQMGGFPGYAGNTLVDGIVFMKAQYGFDSNGDGAINSWSDGTTVVNNTNSGNVLAIRVGIVARSPLYEREVIDAPTTLTVLPAPTSPVGGSAVTYTVPDRHYRYKVYSTIIPLRNVIWGR